MPAQFLSIFRKKDDPVADALNSRYLAYFFLILTVMSWGFATVVIKATVDDVPPLTFLMLRFWIVGIMLVPAAFYILRRNKINLTRFRHIFTSSTIGYVAALTLIFIGIEKTTAVEASLITSFSPLMVTAMGFLLLKETVTKREIEGILIAFIGTLFIIFAPLIGTDFSIPEAATTARTTLIGNIIFLCGITLDGMYSIYTKKYISHDKVITPWIQIVFGFIFAAIIFTPLGIHEQYRIYDNRIFGGIRECTINDIDLSNYQAGLACDARGCFRVANINADNPNNHTVERYECIIKSNAPTPSEYISENIRGYLTSNSLYGILYMSFIAGILAYVCFQLGLKRIEAGEASVFYYLQPLFGIPAAIIFLGEEIHVFFIIGAIFVAAGVIRTETDKQKWFQKR